MLTLQLCIDDENDHESTSTGDRADAIRALDTLMSSGVLSVSSIRVLQPSCCPWFPLNCSPALHPSDTTTWSPLCWSGSYSVALSCCATHMHRKALRPCGKVPDDSVSSSMCILMLTVIVCVAIPKIITDATVHPNQTEWLERCALNTRVLAGSLEGWNLRWRKVDS